MEIEEQSCNDRGAVLPWRNRQSADDANADAMNEDYSAISAAIGAPDTDDGNAATGDWGFLLEPVPRGARRADLVRSVVDDSPSSVHDRSNDGLRPIDTLTAQILMKEERLKYLQRQRRKQQQGHSSHPKENDQRNDDGVAMLSLDLDDTWECARLVAEAHGAASSSSSLLETGSDRHCHGLPMIHACLRTPYTPTALLERSLQRYPEQLRQPDSRGNLPLHYATARLRPRPAAVAAVVSPSTETGAFDTDDDADEDEGETVLSRIFAQYPDAARIQNSAGEWPVTVAIRAGRPWRAVLLLATAHPEALVDLDRHRNRLPLILVGLMRRVRESGEMDRIHHRMAVAIAFRLVRSTPDAVPSP